MKLRWQKQLPRFADYKPYYKDLKMVPLSYTDDDVPIEMVMTQNLLEVVFIILDIFLCYVTVYFILGDSCKMCITYVNMLVYFKIV